MNWDACTTVIETDYLALCTRAEALVVDMARNIMRTYSDLHEFVMAMGSAGFTAKNGEDVFLDDKRYKALKPLDDFLAEWDSKFKITGSPMRFTCEGSIVRNW